MSNLILDYRLSDLEFAMGAGPKSQPTLPLREI